MPSKHGEYIHEVVKLKTWYVHRRIGGDLNGLEEALSKVAGLPAHFDFDRPGIPAWNEMAAVIRGLFEASGNDVDGLEKAVLDYLSPYLEAGIERDMARRGESLKKSYCGFSYEYIPHYLRPGSPDHLTLHFQNYFAPDSPFHHLRELFEGLARITDRAGLERPDVALAQCATGLNSHPAFQKLFPPEWLESAVPQEPAGHMGWWGQFVERDGGFNYKGAALFRATGEFPLKQLVCSCGLTLLKAHWRACLRNQNRPEGGGKL